MNDRAFVSSRPGLSVDGREDERLRDALTGMVVNLPLNGVAHAELVLTNWGLDEGERDPNVIFQGLGLGARIEISLGEEDPRRVFDGEVTGIEERYGEGAPQLVLLLQDKLHHLARRRNSRAFEDQSPDDIVQAVAGEAGLRVDSNVSSITSTFHQINESDLAFLFRLLGRFDIGLRLAGDTLRARAEEQDPEPIRLDAQDNANRVRLIADLNHQPLSPRVLGFNPGNAEATDGSADALESPPAGTTAAATLNRLGWAGEEVVPRPFARSQAEADAFAQAHFGRQAGHFLSGDIQCQGEPTLSSGREIDLQGVSERLRGTYRVVHTVHRFDGESGYETHIRVRRPDWQV
jgi:phage protein D